MTKMLPDLVPTQTLATDGDENEEEHLERTKD